MNKELIRDLAIKGGIYDCICDPYDKLKNGDPYSSVMVDLERFAEKIVRECANFISPLGDWCGGHGEPRAPSTQECAKMLKKHFGVEE